MIDQSLYDDYAERAWKLKILKNHQRKKCSGNGYASSFSKETYLKANRRKILRTNPRAVTSTAVMDSILNPTTAVGQIILSRSATPSTLEAMRLDPIRRNAQRSVIQRVVQFFPSYLLNNDYSGRVGLVKKSWITWCPIVDDFVILSKSCSSPGTLPASVPVPVPVPALAQSTGHCIDMYRGGSLSASASASASVKNPAIITGVCDKRLLNLKQFKRKII